MISEKYFWSSFLLIIAFAGGYICSLLVTKKKIKKVIKEKENLISEKTRKEEKARKIWEMSETVYREKRRLDEQMTNILAEKEKLEEEKKKFKEKNVKLWEQSVSIHKERTRIDEIKKDIERKHRDVTDSIRYAKLIQEAILPPDEQIKQLLPHSFILYKPRDIVSGDFYWMSKKENSVIFIAADCTGHGVPGAFMSMMGNSFLNEIVNKKGIIKPNAVLDELRDDIISSLKQTGRSGENKEGMDMAFCMLDKNTLLLEYAGANNPLWIFKHNGEFIEVKPDKQPVAISAYELNPFTNNTIQLEQGDVIYIFSDGFQDQFGGEDGRKFMKKRLRESFTKIYHQPIKEQKNMLDKIIESWKSYPDAKGKPHEQVDDILVIGVKID